MVSTHFYSSTRDEGAIGGKASGLRFDALRARQVSSAGKTLAVERTGDFGQLR